MEKERCWGSGGSERWRVLIPKKDFNHKTLWAKNFRLKCFFFFFFNYLFYLKLFFFFFFFFFLDFEVQIHFITCNSGNKYEKIEKMGIWNLRHFFLLFITPTHFLCLFSFFVSLFIFFLVFSSALRRTNSLDPPALPAIDQPAMEWAICLWNFFFLIWQISFWILVRKLFALWRPTGSLVIWLPKLKTGKVTTATDSEGRW